MALDCFVLLEGSEDRPAAPVTTVLLRPRRKAPSNCNRSIRSRNITLCLAVNSPRNHRRLGNEASGSEQLVAADCDRSGLPVDTPLDSNSSPQERGIVDEISGLLPFKNVPDATVPGHNGTLQSGQRTHGMVAVFLFQLAVAA